MSFSSFAKGSLKELNQQTQAVRAQVNDQLKCLDGRIDNQIHILSEMNEFFKKKAELDADYARSMEKLAKSCMLKHKNERSKRSQWPLFSTCTLYQQLVDDFKEEAKLRAQNAEVMGNVVTQAVINRCNTMHKMSKKARSVGEQAYGELIRVLDELASAMKTYHSCHSDFITVDSKWRLAKASKEKSVDSQSLKKQKSVQKTFDKVSTKYEAAAIKDDRARNEYLLCIDAANAAMHKYYGHDISELIDGTDVGFEHWLQTLLANLISLRKNACQQEMTSLAGLSTFRESLQLSVDKQKFFEANSTVFMLPKPFEFRRDSSENVSHVVVSRSLGSELSLRRDQIVKRLGKLNAETNEYIDAIEHQDDHIKNLISTALTVQITDDGIVDNRPPVDVSEGALEEANQIYWDKLRHLLLNGNLMSRLEARANSISAVLNNHPGPQSHEELRSLPQSPSSPEWLARTRRTRRVNPDSRSSLQKRPRLFGGSLAEYTELTGEEIPLVVISCIRLLSLHALHHQGVFRVSGSQVDINAMKEAFEQGEDPLVNTVSPSDVNSIAGVLKAYLRELREPLFPVYLFEQLTNCAKCADVADFTAQITPLLSKLPVATYRLLRYLFAFLNRLSQNSDENMMDPYNLAICFGPTLLPIPDDKDQVYYQNSVNEVVKNLIEYHSSIFSSSIPPGPVYRAYDDGVNYADDEDEFNASGVGGSEAGSSRNGHHADFGLMTNSIHSSLRNHNGMERQIANAAAAIASQRRSLYGNSILSPNPASNVMSYEEGDERSMLRIGQTSTPHNLNMPSSAASSIARASISSESTASSSGNNQKENRSNSVIHDSPSLNRVLRTANTLQERSSVDSGIGAKPACQQTSPGSSNTTDSSGQSALNETYIVNNADKSISRTRTIRSIPLSAQMSFHNCNDVPPPMLPISRKDLPQSESLRALDSGKVTPISNVSITSSPTAEKHSGFHTTEPMSPTVTPSHLV
uniref:Rho-GAP domain-containing protein n=1 Tax=Panagrellus redivivus TaxID=6233 RepID=A0A7E4W175_PANRE